MREQCNRELFASWCALTAAGYDLAEPTGVTVELMKGIQALPLDAQTRTWFGQARTDSVEVNPWFPRASALSAGCFFMDKPLDALLSFIQSTGTTMIDDAFMEWIAPYQAYIEAVEQLNGFASLWDRYREAILTDQVGAMLKALQLKLLSYGYSIEEELIFVPNRLQSPFLADYVYKQGELYVICSSVNLLGIVHEYLHRALRGFEPIWLRIATTTQSEWLLDLSEMKKYGYMLDDSPKSVAHALEDCVVRAVSALIVGENTRTYAHDYREAGFTFAATLMEEAAFAAPERGALLQLVNNALKRL